MTTLPESNIKNILAVDCGSVNTTAVLIEFVAGQFRLRATGQAPSTYDTPWQDITLGIQEAARQIEKETGRALLAPGGWPITPQNASQQGADAFIIVSSAGPPLPLILAGLMQDITLASARRAAATSYTHIANELSLDDARNNGPRNIEAQMQTIQEEQVEVILLVGGIDGGAEWPVIEMANLISIAMRVLPARDKPDVLFAGNKETRAQVAEILGPVARLKAVDNVRPTLDSENLAAIEVELESYYIQRRMSRLPGFDELKNWSQFPIMPASRSFERVIAYIGQHDNRNVIGVDVGSGATVVSTQAQGYHSSIIRSDIGVGHSLASLLKMVPIKKFQRWLPFEIDEGELYNQLLNKCLHPTSIPTTHEELIMEYAVAREALRLTIEQARTGWPLQQSTGLHDVQWNLIIAAGRTLTGAPQLGYAVLTLLDGIEPWGATSLALDVGSVTNVLGAIAAVEPVAAVEVVQSNVLSNLGTVIAPIGHGQPGKPALKLKIDYADNKTIEADSKTKGINHASPDINRDVSKEDGDTLEIEVPYGSLKVIDLPLGTKAILEMRPTRHFDIGLGQPGRGALTEVEGGILGIIVDARGRPLRLPRDHALRQAQLKQWLTELGVKHADFGDNN